MVLLAGLVLALGPGGVFAYLASDDAGTPVVRSPSAIEIEFVPAGSANWQVLGPSDRSEFGQSVAFAGNVDGYGGDDVIVGAPIKGASQGEGTAYLYLNNAGAALNTTASWEKSGGAQGAYYGQSVAGAGDVNGDNYDDVIIGAPGFKTEFKVGRAYLYQGEPSAAGLTIDHTWSYTGTVQDGDFGHVVAGAGDVNNDGYDDVIVGAPYYTDPLDPQDSEGAVYLFYGSDSEEGLHEAPDWLIDSDQPNTLFGWSMSAAGYVNDDTYADFIVGAPRYVNPETGLREGAVLLFLGGASQPAGPAWIAYGGQEYSWFGNAVAGAGDVNGDGHPDIVVGARLYDKQYLGQVGAAFAFCGNGASFDSDPCWMAYGDQVGLEWGYGTAVGGAGDVNADGFEDIIVGAPSRLERLPDDTQPEGAAFIYFGSATGLAPWAGWKARGDKARTQFGFSVDGGGQVTGNAADSVVIGAPKYWKSEVPWGAAFSFYGPLEPGELNRTYLPLVMSNAN